MTAAPLASRSLFCAVLTLCGCTSSLDFDATAGSASLLDASLGGADASLATGADASGTTKADASVEDPAVGVSVPTRRAFVPCREQVPAPTFCDDFDSVPLTDKWTQLLTSPVDGSGGRLQTDATDAVSQTNSLVVVTQPGLPAGTYLALAARHELALFWEKPFYAEVEFDMKVEQIDLQSDRKLLPFQFLFGSQANGWYAQLMLTLQSRGTSLGARFGENDVDVTFDAKGAPTDLLRHQEHPMYAGPPLHKWVHVRFVVDIQGTGRPDNHVALFLDDTILYEGPMRFPLKKLEPRVEIGAPWVDTGSEGDREGSATWRVRYDNFVLRASEPAPRAPAP